MDFVCLPSLDRLPASADALFAQGERESLFLSRVWLENLIATAPGETEGMALACVVAGDEVLAILPLMKGGPDSWRALSHRYGAHYSLLLPPDLPAERKREIVACLVDGLDKMSIRGLLLEPVEASDRRISLLQQSMRAHGFDCNLNFRFYNWILRLEGRSFDEYMATWPSRLRHTIARKRRKLAREQALEIRLHCGDSAPAAMPDYYRVYDASWKAQEQHRDFIDGMVAGFSRQGATRLAILHVNGKPAAAQLWFVLHSKACIFRLAYDETWKRYSPGSILTAFLMQHVIDVDGVEEVDFLVGNEAYKQEWMSERREKFALGCARTIRPKNRFVTQMYAWYLAKAGRPCSDTDSGYSSWQFGTHRPCG